MDKSSRKWNKVFLLGVFGIVFAFGMPVSLVFADEIPYYIDGEIIRYDYTDWDTFYRRCNQYAPQYRYYTILVSDVYSDRRNSLSRFGTERFTYINSIGTLVTMTFFNQSKKERIQVIRNFERKLGIDGGEKLIEPEHEFTDYNEAFRFWQNAVDMIR